jgi:His-Xaa-Ser system protein HxsD
MKEILKKIEGNKLLLTVANDIYENEAILNTSYKFTDRCYINIEQIGSNTEIYFQIKDENIDIENIALTFGNELIDQQVRLNTGREFKVIREELVKKAFSSVS